MNPSTTLTLPELDIGQLSAISDVIQRQVTVMEAQLEMEARELCAAFTKARAEIQKSLGEATTKAEFKERFAPLVLHSRVHKGSLEITWSLQKGRTRPTGNKQGRRIMETLKKGKGYGYRLPDLISLSRDYELLLVTEAERRAAVIREMWSKVVALRVSLRTVGRICERSGAGAEPLPQPSPKQAGAADADDVKSERLAAAEAAVLSHQFDKNDLGASAP